MRDISLFFVRLLCSRKRRCRITDEKKMEEKNEKVLFRNQFRAAFRELGPMHKFVFKINWSLQIHDRTNINRCNTFEYIEGAELDGRWAEGYAKRKAPRARCFCVYICGEQSDGYLDFPMVSSLAAVSTLHMNYPLRDAVISRSIKSDCFMIILQWIFRCRTAGIRCNIPYSICRW